MDLKLYHFMPDKLNLYGDIGNVIALSVLTRVIGLIVKLAAFGRVILNVPPLTNTTSTSLVNVTDDVMAVTEMAAPAGDA